MAYFSQEELDSIRKKADIVEVVSHYLPIHKKGNSYKVVCPFHDDHDPSMILNPDLQIYKCFVCGAGGNVFSFVQNYEHVSFPESVEKVADLVGVTLSEHPVEKKTENPVYAKYYSILNEAIRYSMYEIDSAEAVREKEYLEKRGLTKSVRDRFQIGYVPDHNKLYNFLHAKGYEDADLIAVNLVRNTGTGIQDVFFKRITFPIHDENGNPVGFSARTIDPNNDSKYINTTNTEIYVKGNIVYNAHRAKQEARRQRKIYVCEGVTDVIAFDVAGMPNAVCTLGTSCTEEQLRCIKRLSREIVFCYDGDAAGQHATMRGIQMARAIGCEVSVVENTTGKDPDEIVRQDGREALQQLASRQISWIEFAIKYEESRTNMDSYLEKKEFVEKIQGYIRQLPDEMDRKYFRDLISTKTGLDIREDDARPIDPVEHKPLHKVVPDGTQIAEEYILSMMMRYPSACRLFEEELGYLLDEKRQVLATMILNQVHKTGSCDPSVVMDSCSDPSLQNVLAGILSKDVFQQELDKEVFEGMIRKVKYEYLQSEVKALHEQLTGTLNATSRQILLQKYTECLQKLRGYIHEEDEC